MLPAWDLWTDVLAGQDKIKAKKHTYLPKEPGELDEDYDRRLAQSLFFEDARDCQINLGGMVFRKSPSLRDDVPELLRQFAENIDNAGTHINVFLQRLFEDAFYGHSFIVIDRPPQSPDVRTAADEIASGARSYWCMRQAKDAVNFRPLVINGKTGIGQISFKECTKEPDGRFGEQEVVRYRVYLLDDQGDARWELWRETGEIDPITGNKKMVLESGDLIRTKRGAPLKRLPIAVHYGEREGFLESRPPLKGIADIVIAFYQKYSDLSHLQHYTCVPTLVVTGINDDTATFKLGGNQALILPSGATAAFISANGESLDRLWKDLEMLQKRLIAKGLDFVQEDHRHPATATEITLAYTERTSKLAKMVRSLIDCTENALQITAEIEGIEMPSREDGGGSISVGVDENALTLTPDQLRILSEMNERGQLTLRTLWAIMQRADQLPEDFDADKEEAAVNAAAIAQMELNAKQFDAGLESTP